MSENVIERVISMTCEAPSPPESSLDPISSDENRPWAQKRHLGPRMVVSRRRRQSQNAPGGLWQVLRWLTPFGAVAREPGRSYNPLFLYGGVGLGKTHLLHAIGQHVTSQKKNARVTYVSSEKFTNEFIDAIQNNQLVRVRRKYRQTDVFLIDFP